MVGNVLRVGDRVSLMIHKENREWGYNPYEDGTTADVTGFGEITYGRIGNFGREPGVYVNTSWVKVRLDTTGEDRMEWDGRVSLLDEEEYERRLAAWRAEGAPFGGERLRDLPETDFWEGDLVRAPAHPDVKCVQGINYAWMRDTRNDGTPMGFYDCSSDLYAGWHVTLRPQDLELIERGPVWKWFHDEPIEWKSLEEEAKFHNLLGLTDEVKNPACDLYKWDKDEALAAIRDGIGHAMTMGNGLFGSGPRISVVKYRDEQLGKKVASYTLANF